MDFTHATVAFHPQQSLNASPVQQQAHHQSDRRQSQQRQNTLSMGNDDSMTVAPPGSKGVGVMGELHGDLRRDSTTTNSGNELLVSNESQHHAWDPQQFNAGLPSGSRLAANQSNQYYDDGHTFMTPSVSQQSAFVQPTMHQQWTATSGAVGPGFNAEYMPHAEHFSHDDFAGSAMASAQVTWSDHSLGHVETSQPVANGMQVPYMTTPLMSYGSTDHMALADHDVAHRRNSRRLHSRTPQRTVPEARQGDGVRKKNGRIDIPAGRNINNIDMLIETANDDALVVELKSQKRLLRNREAALTSRQRKKQYTEELEHREKIANARLAAYEVALARFEGIEQVLKASQDHVATLQQENKDLIDQHEHEIAELRLSVQALEERLEAGPAPSMSAVPSSTGFTELNESVAAMNFAISEHPADQGWHEFIQVDDVADEYQDSSAWQPQVARQRELEPKASVATLVPNAQSKTDSTAAQPVASSLLFMMLLCGALFASKPASSQMPDMPAVPDMLRTAAGDILQVLLESDLSSSNGPLGSAREMLSSDNMPAAQSLPVDEIYGDMTTTFDHHQDIEQTFGLGSMQYESLTNQDYAEEPSDYHVGRRSRNLAQALMELQRKHSLGSKADVFVRSLLWDQIPEHVVQEFKQMIRQHQATPNPQKQQFQFSTPEQLNSIYKTEP